MTATVRSALPRGPVSLPRTEFQRRRRAVARRLSKSGCGHFVGFTAATVRYLAGFPAAESERPVAVLVDASGRASLFVPLLKAADAATAPVDDVVTYPEFPGDEAPLALLARHLSALGGDILAEADDYASVHGYRGPGLSTLLATPPRIDPDLVETMRKRKSPAEIALVRHACAWAVLAQSELLAAIRVGSSESAVSGAATGAAMRRLRAKLAGHRDFMRPVHVSAGFGGQIGPDGTADHKVAAIDPVIRAGDMMISRVQAMIGGYYADIERTMVAGPVSSTVAELFRRGHALHTAALGLIRPGVCASEIDGEMKRLYSRLGLAEGWRHHTGHSVGLLTREAPYLDVGDTTVLEPGMVVTVEPGLYQRGVGGFRHSDCVLVTESGCEILTPFASDLPGLTVG